ncbi:6-phosphogluconolactonase/Glucosamine-6-phosphateisomerase/deaminase [Alteromonadaceae bacterium Bs31]|nr:6-phosphogluconolactonase/Glucosamine-6-phosphateisomerase/deaminase [Alteromonadaceae bacterium Bs31]
MSSIKSSFTRYEANDNVWLSPASALNCAFTDHGIKPCVLASEAEVGKAMLNELYSTAAAKEGDINIALLGGRGAQELHRLLGEMATSTAQDELLARLNVFTQDALAPMGMGNGFSFVRDFERILGEAFFKKIKSFTPMRTDSSNLEAGLTEYLHKLETIGGLDIFFIGHGPEENQASHLAYIKPFSGAQSQHVAGIIPISSSILEHHISKFKAGGSIVSDSDEKECRTAEYILTLGPAAILQAKKVVQSVVDADSAPAKIKTYSTVLNTRLSSDRDEALQQLNANPGLWIRLHPNTQSFVLPNLGVSALEC